MAKLTNYTGICVSFFLREEREKKFYREKINLLPLNKTKSEPVRVAVAQNKPFSLRDYVVHI